MSIVYINGEFVSADQAKISVFDRGFLLGDGVYEVIPAYSGQLFRFEEHLQRLQTSLDAIQLKNHFDKGQWHNLLTQLVEQNYQPDLSIYLQVTRGIAVRDHAFPADTQPTVFAMANSISPLSDQVFENGVASVTLPDNRWSRCNIKAISLLPNVLLRQQAVEQGVVEAILVRENHVTEGAAANVFIVEAGSIITPPKNNEILPGITRDLVIELALQQGLPVKESKISLEQLKSADEVWLTSSTKEILPVTNLDQTPVANGKPGETWKTMIQVYRDYKKSLHDNAVTS